MPDRHYVCFHCGAAFDEPEYKTVRENLDGERGIWEHEEAVCPYCGKEDIEEVYSDDEESDGDPNPWDEPGSVA